MRSPPSSPESPVAAARQVAGVSALVAALLAVSPSAAMAGRTAHLLVEEAEIIPEGEVELEQWLWLVNPPRTDPARPVSHWIWWAPVTSLNPHLELSAPVELVGSPGELSLANVGVRARLRLRPRLEDDGLQALVRLSYMHAIGAFGAPELQLNLVATYGNPRSARLTANVGAQLAMPALRGAADPVSFSGTAAIAGSVPMPNLPSLRLSGEVLLEVGPQSPRLRAGPTLAWVHGPLWITAGALFGLTDATPSVLTKVLWGILL